MSNITTTISTLFFIIFIFYFSPASGNENKVRVVTENLPPFQIQKTNTLLTGAMVELIELVLTSADIESEIEVLPWARAYQFALTEPNTLIFSMIRSKTREDKFQWIGKVYSIHGLFIKRSESKDIEPKTIDDVKTYKVGVLRDDLSEHYLRRLNFTENINMYIANNNVSLWQHLMVGNIDMLVSNSTSWYNTVVYAGYKPEHVTPIMLAPDFDSDYYFAASKGSDPALVQKLTQALDDIKASGQYQAILDKWQL